MEKKSIPLGILLLLTTTTIWGGMFPVAKNALISVDGFYLTSIRYGFGSLMFAVILLCIEGRHAFILEEKILQLFYYGTLGFAGFGLFVFVGLEYTQPEHGAIIMGLMPLITAMVKWFLKKERPSNFTLFCVAIAFLGVLLVISKGDLLSLLKNGANIGDLLVLTGAICWVIYTMGAADFPGWSPLRYTTLSCLLGTITILAATAIATLINFARLPTMQTLAMVEWEIVYLVVLSVVVAVLCWNSGIKILGPLNGVLFINLVPVTAFTIVTIQGIQFQNIQLFGVILTISALISNNLYARYEKKLAISNTQNSCVEN